MDLRTILVITHIVGTALGVGGATVSDYLFFKFARDGRLDKDELRILKTVSDIVWAGLLILLLSGLGFIVLYALNHQAIRSVYNLDKIWAKATIVIVLLINGFVLHRRVLPLFASRLGKSFATPQFIKKSTVIFVAGATSFVSWYSALILGAWRNLTADYLTIMLVYVMVWLIAAVVATLSGKYLLHHLSKRS